MSRTGLHVNVARVSTAFLLVAGSAGLAPAQTMVPVPENPSAQNPVRPDPATQNPASRPPETPASNTELTDLSLTFVPQDPLPEPAKPTHGFLGALVHNLGDDVKHLPRRNSLYWLLGGGALSLAAHPADQSLNRHLLGSTTADKIFIPGKYVGATEVQIAASFVTYIVGRTNHEPRVQHLGMDLLEAQILAEGIVEGVKVIVRRHRPLFPDGSSSPGYAFPSGHAAVTFASATVLQQHLGWKAAVPTYAVATYVAASRLHDNRHYLSDVVFGATTGIVIGRSVTWHGRNTYTLAPVPIPGGMGCVIIW